MEKENDQLILELNSLLMKPGGKQAARFLLNAFGATPLIGGMIAGAGNLWGEKEQQNFNEKITEWASNANVDISKILQVLDSQLREPTKSNLALLVGEVFGEELPNEYPNQGELGISSILHGETLAEFKTYEKKGWITIIPTHNMTNMGAGNRIGDATEDRKRPWGMGNGFNIVFNRTLYEE